MQALEEAGYLLAHGEKRDYVILDAGGGVHSLARRAGARASALRERLSAYEPQHLPSVAEARALQRERGRLLNEPVRRYGTRGVSVATFAHS
jgi:hypothetical protein